MPRGTKFSATCGWISQGVHKGSTGLKLAATWDPLISLFAHLSFRKAPPPGRIFAYKIFGKKDNRGGCILPGSSWRTKTV